MKNIFLLYMAPGNPEQMVHYQDTIKNKVAQDRILKYLSFDAKAMLREVFGNQPVPVWGSRNSPANRSRFEKMRTGDDVLIVEGKRIKLLGKITCKVISSDLSRELWHNLKGDTKEGWDLIYFIANATEIDLPFNTFKKLFGYKLPYTLRGFSNVAEEKVREFYDQFDDLYSVLLKVKHDEKPETKQPFVREMELTFQPKAIEAEEVDEILSELELSDHVRMQWKLVRLGLKSGATVWVPKNDQGRIQAEYEFSEFPKEFAAGIDMPAKYVENIDVIWKEEFRVDGAFEIENSTAIYSGLLRFADLKIVAPNSNYPLFIVAPLSKKGRLIEQVRRPTFQKLELSQKVKYLSYEVVDDVDKFFADAKSGFSVDILAGKSESVF
jgi:hypothetical protein